MQWEKIIRVRVFHIESLRVLEWRTIGQLEEDRLLWLGAAVEQQRSVGV